MPRASVPQATATDHYVLEVHVPRLQVHQGLARRQKPSPGPPVRMAAVT